ncbi:unnamed protein product, partial [Aureobasidium uvarum]
VRHRSSIPEDLISDVYRKRNFLDDQELSDVVIKFGDKQVFAHKIMLANGSAWFEKALLGSFSEANKKIIELHDDINPEVIMAMLKHLYGSNYYQQKILIGINGSAAFHLEVFMLGDKYDISSLREEASERFTDVLEHETDLVNFHDATIHAIQRLLGPDASQLADQSLVKTTKALVLGNYDCLFWNKTFRRLLARGTMLEEDLAYDFLDKVLRRDCARPERS